MNALVVKQGIEGREVACSIWARIVVNKQVKIVVRQVNIVVRQVKIVVRQDKRARD